MQTEARHISRKLSTRLREFMGRYDLTRNEMAVVITTPRGTLDHWLDDAVNPPACLLALMDVLEEESRVRTRLGVHCAKPSVRGRGRPFRRGNEFRFNDRRRSQALQRARAE
jgi:hypothetical protein